MIPALAAAAPPSPALEGLLARPLFSATRRPIPTDLPAAPGADAEDAPRLAGTMIDGDHGRTALLALPRTSKLLTAHEGETVGRYRIARIGPGEVLAETASGPIVLRVNVRPAPSTPVPAVDAPVADLRRANGAPDQDE